MRLILDSAINSIPICKSTMSCVSEVDSKYTRELSDECNCWPSCEHLAYIVERTKAGFTEYVNNTIRFLFYKNIFSTNPIQATTEHKSVEFKVRFRPGDHFPIVRRQHFTVTEIFAFIGGLLGLFLGFSVVSFAEVVNVMLQPLLKMFSSVISFSPIRFFQKTNRFFKAFDKIKSYIGFFLKKSSIHSFNFMANSSNCVGRFFWFLTFCFSMTGCVLMILQLHRTTDLNAVTLVIDDRLMDVSEIPFPAVTIHGRFTNYYKLYFPYIHSHIEIVRSFANWEVRLPGFKPNMSQFETTQHPTSKYSKLNFCAARILFLFSYC